MKRNGRIITKSLKTKNLKEAQRKIEAEGLDSFVNQTPTEKPRTREQQVPAPEVEEKKSPVTEITLKEALERHMDGLICESKGSEEMLGRCSKKVLEYAENFENFDAVSIWKSYRASGIKTRGKELGSACNHMLWYLGKFVPWAVTQGHLPESAKDSLSRIKKVKVNPRRIRVPSVEVVREFLAMIETEDPDGADFLRFLGTCGLRVTGARNLKWTDIDFDRMSMAVMMKGGSEKIMPLTPEAQGLLLARKGKSRPWDFDNAGLKRLKKRMVRFAKGFDIDLHTFHNFRHYFASQCLLSGMTVQEVAELLGHSDDGELVLRTYGHLCREHLRTAVAGLRLVS